MGPLYSWVVHQIVLQVPEDFFQGLVFQNKLVTHDEATQSSTPHKNALKAPKHTRMHKNDLDPKATLIRNPPYILIQKRP